MLNFPIIARLTVHQGSASCYQDLYQYLQRGRRTHRQGQRCRRCRRGRRSSWSRRESIFCPTCPWCTSQWSRRGPLLQSWSGEKKYQFSTYGYFSISLSIVLSVFCINQTDRYLPNEESEMRRNIEISRVIRETIVDHRVSKPVKSYQEKVSSSDGVTSY